MKPDTLNTLEAKFQAHPVIRGGRVDRAEVNALENAVGFALPADYREFVEKYGGAIVGPFSVYGLRAARAMAKNESSAWEVTKHFRSEGWPGVENWLVISSNQSGNPVGLDAAGKVWISDHDTGTIDSLASSFEDYLRKWCLKLEPVS